MLFRSPTEKIWPASPRQQKGDLPVGTCSARLLAEQDLFNAVASRVTRALELTMSQPMFLETLVKDYGVCIEEVCNGAGLSSACLHMLHQSCVHLAGSDVS